MSQLGLQEGNQIRGMKLISNQKALCSTLFHFPVRFYSVKEHLKGLASIGFVQNSGLRLFGINNGASNNGSKSSRIVFFF